MFVRFLLIVVAGILCALSGRAEAVTTIERGENGNWLLYVDERPYFIKGVEYSPDPAMSRPDYPNQWMHEDTDRNGRNDAAYDSWIDANRDNYRDACEDSIGDFQLLKDMGCNTIRIYHSEDIKVSLLRDLYKTYGIRVIMGNLFGAYTIGSGAEWCDGTDYTNSDQRKKMKEGIRAMVEQNKDEPYLLMYMLGNENDATGSEENSTLNNTNAVAEPVAFAKFVNEVCEMIKDMDPDHPVGICLATYRLLPALAEHAPALDVIGLNSYAGAYGFGPLWQRVKTTYDRPVLITEYGTDCYDLKKDVVDEDYQALYHRRAWEDIAANSYWGEKAGNSIGGVAFCWMDKWWLIGLAKLHDTFNGARPGPNRGGFFCDEWLGLCGQGFGTNIPLMRDPRKVYYQYRNILWRSARPFETDYFSPVIPEREEQYAP